MKDYFLSNKAYKVYACIIIGLIIFFLLTPGGLSTGTWLYFAIFIGVVVGLILEPVPPAFIGIIGVTLAVLFKIGPV